jgi:hypothetical protein
MNSTRLFPAATLINPITCLFGVFTNTINIAVFLNRQLKDSTYKYMMCHSLSNLFYLTIITFNIMSDCAEFCSTSGAYSMRIYELLFIDYLTSSLALFSILIDINLSLQRYLIVSNSRLSKFFTFKFVVPATFIFALIYYAPVLFLKDIVSNSFEQTNATVSSYKLVQNDFGKSPLGHLISIVLTSFRIFLATIVLGFMNILSAYKFYMHLKSKKKKRNHSTLSGNCFFFNVFHLKIII